MAWIWNKICRLFCVTTEAYLSNYRNNTDLELLRERYCQRYLQRWDNERLELMKFIIRSVRLVTVGWLNEEWVGHVAHKTLSRIQSKNFKVRNRVRHNDFDGWITWIRIWDEEGEKTGISCLRIKSNSRWICLFYKCKGLLTSQANPMAPCWETQRWTSLGLATNGADTLWMALLYIYIHQNIVAFNITRL
jgi:hypothetical protein